MVTEGSDKISQMGRVNSEFEVRDNSEGDNHRMEDSTTSSKKPSEPSSYSFEKLEQSDSNTSLGMDKANSMVDQLNLSQNFDVSPPHTPIDTDDEYDLSERGDSIHESSPLSRPSLKNITSLSEQLDYVSQTLCAALDLVELDESLAIQAKTSGLLNSEAHRLLDKTRELRECLCRLDTLYKENFVPQYDLVTKTSVRKIDVLNHRYEKLEKRLNDLIYGKKPNGITKLFGGKRLLTGVADQFPIEYNKARDKVVERTLGD